MLQSGGIKWHNKKRLSISNSKLYLAWLNVLFTNGDKTLLSINLKWPTQETAKSYMVSLTVDKFLSHFFSVMHKTIQKVGFTYLCAFVFVSEMSTLTSCIWRFFIYIYFCRTIYVVHQLPFVQYTANWLWANSPDPFAGPLEYFPLSAAPVYKDPIRHVIPAGHMRLLICRVILNRVIYEDNNMLERQLPLL